LSTYVSGGLNRNELVRDHVEAARIEIALLRPVVPPSHLVQMLNEGFDTVSGLIARRAGDLHRFEP
jgi:hypothetical protein